MCKDVVYYLWWEVYHCEHVLQQKKWARRPDFIMKWVYMKFGANEISKGLFTFQPLRTFETLKLKAAIASIEGSKDNDIT